MQRPSRKLLLPAVLLFWLALLPTPSALPGAPASATTQPPLRIDFPEFWPFFATRNDRVEGFFHDIVTEALGRMDIKATWSPFPWPRCQERVKTGEADAMITVPTPRRLRYAATHAEPFYEKKLQIFTYAGHPRMREIKAIRNVDDIRRNGFVVVTYSGNGWNDKLIRARGVKTYETPKLINVWRMLANRRGDIVIEWPGGAWPDIVGAGLEKEIVQTDVTLRTMPFHLLIRKSSPYVARLPEFNRVIQKMKRDGVLQRVVEKYIRQYRANPELPPLSEPGEKRVPLLAYF